MSSLDSYDIQHLDDGFWSESDGPNEFFLPSSLSTMTIRPARKRAKRVYQKHCRLFGAYEDGSNPIYLEPTNDPAPLVWLRDKLGICALDGFQSGACGDGFKGPRNPAAWELAQRLLRIDGLGVRFDSGEWSFCGPFAAYSELLKPVRVLKQIGEPQECHANSLKLWDATGGQHSFMTGFALINGYWLRHSWLLSDNNEVLETTLDWDHYFGVRLGPGQTYQMYVDWFDYTPGTVTRDNLKLLQANRTCNDNVLPHEPLPEVRPS